MIITQTPVRISFFGGGTDYPAYYREHGGEVLSAAIDHYTFVTVHPLTRFSDHCLRVHYSRVEAVTHIDKIEHPSARECLRFAGIESGLEIHYVSDLPARTGLGSSSSATVGLLMALHAHKGKTIGREQVARDAVHVEQEMIKERVGSQDQYTCALGGLNHFVFHKDGEVRCEPLALTQERRQALQDRLMLFYTGIQRQAHEVLEEQIERTRSGDNAASLAQMKQMVSEGMSILTGSDPLDEFGSLLDRGWQLKRSLSSKITSPVIDQHYDKAIAAGASGGKLLGAGGGGFLLLCVEPEKQQAVRDAMGQMPEVRIRFDNQGTQVVYYRP